MPTFLLRRGSNVFGNCYYPCKAPAVDIAINEQKGAKIMKTIKSVLSVILCIAMLSSLPIETFAEGLPGERLGSNNEIVENAFGSHVESRIIRKVDTKTYRIPNSEYTSIVSTYEDNLGYKVLLVQEGSILDTILYTPDGKMYVNGGLVSVIKGGTEKNEPPSRMYSVDYSTTPWYGPDSNYSIYAGSVQNASVYTGGELLKSLAIATIAEIIGDSIGTGVGYALGLFLTIASSIRDSAEVYAPTSQYLSYSGYKYEHSTQSMPTNRYFKYDVSYYANANYNTYVGNSVYYENSYFT
jgi:hypothetical protein